MRILHTADWHLGKKLVQFERTDEHLDFLNWLVNTLDQQSIDLLIIAGDIFDTGTPSNTALELYYRFLSRVKDTCCRDVIVIGGNHDSISTLNAPRELLHFFNVHVIGGVPENFTDQIIKIYAGGHQKEEGQQSAEELQPAKGFQKAAGPDQGQGPENAAGLQLAKGPENTAGQLSGEDRQPAIVVCAVPFLRDRDIRLSIAGETSDERESRIKQGITEHYHKFLPYIEVYKAAGIPVIATGHLFAAGSSTSESEKEIHVGNLGQVRADQFPVAFDYIALGHIHRPQLVNQTKHIRYSGSPIPLSFSENEDRKQVIIIEFNGSVMTDPIQLEVPCHRKLLRIKGSYEYIEEQILGLTDPELKYPTWVELRIDTESLITDLEEKLAILKAGKPFIQEFFTRQDKIKVAGTLDQLTGTLHDLADLTPKEVFLKRCAAETGNEDYTDLLILFDQAVELMEQEKQ